MSDWREQLSEMSRSLRVSMLPAEDEAYLQTLLLLIRSGRRAVIIAECSDDKLKYMFSNCTRAEATSLLGKVVEATGRRMAAGDD